MQFAGLMLVVAHSELVVGESKLPLDNLGVRPKIAVLFRQKILGEAIYERYRS